eukprot:14673367-Heterocapsa_arctica.AAC.1
MLRDYNIQKDDTLKLIIRQKLFKDISWRAHVRLNHLYDDEERPTTWAQEAAAWRAQSIVGVDR